MRRRVHLALGRDAVQPNESVAVADLAVHHGAVVEPVQAAGGEAEGPDQEVMGRLDVLVDEDGHDDAGRRGRRAGGVVGRSHGSTLPEPECACLGRQLTAVPARQTAWCWTGSMFETPEEMPTLQALLDSSMATAGPHLRDIITDERRLSAVELAERLQGMRLLVLATVTADGRPLVGPVDGYFLHGTFWFSTGEASVRRRHLAERPACSA